MYVCRSHSTLGSVADPALKRWWDKGRLSRADSWPESWQMSLATRWRDGLCCYITELLLEWVYGPREIIAFVAWSHRVCYHFSLYSPLLILSEERVVTPAPYYLFQLLLLGLTCKMHMYIATSWLMKLLNFWFRLPRAQVVAPDHETSKLGTPLLATNLPVITDIPNCLVPLKSTK